MGDFEDALAHGPAVTRLHVDFSDGGVLDARVAAFVNLEELQLREVPPDAVLPEELLALPKLRHLGMTGRDDRLVVPELVRRLSIERLDVWDLHASELPPLPQLRHLEIVVSEPKTEVAILAERLNQLVHLEVWGSHLPAGELPDDIERFSRLERLYLVSCGVSALPEAIAKLRALRVFGIRGCPMTELPPVLTRMPELATLELGVELVGLPASLAQMRGLRDLNLSNALNKGAMVSLYDDTSKLKALPRVLGELVGLERLNLDCCGVVDAAVLRPLQQLKALSLSWAGIKDVETIGELASLEELSLESCDQVKDLTPLAKLAKLRVLNLTNTQPESLDVVRRLPALRELHIENIEAERIDAVFEIDVTLHADDEVRERYAGRASLQALPAITDIVAALDARDVAAVEAACDHLATWAIASSTRGSNALATLGRGYVPALDLMLDRHLARLSPAVLAKLFGALFHEVGDEFAAAARIAKELVSRPDVAAQHAMIDAFAKANEHYDTGHREHGTGVHDELIEVVFPLLEPAPLAALLAWCSDGHLDPRYGDGMVALFAPALERAGEPEQGKLVERLEAFLGRAEVDVVDLVFAQLADVGGDAITALRARLEDRLAAARKRGDLDARLRDPVRAAGALAEALQLADVDGLTGALWTTNTIEGLSADARRALLALWQRIERDDGIAGALATFAKTLTASELQADVNALPAEARGKLVRQAVLAAIDEDEYPDDALDALRVLAGELDGLSQAAAGSLEARTLLYGGAANYDDDKFRRGVTALARLDTYERGADDDDSELASMVANLAESSEFDVLQQLARHVHKLGLTGKSLERVLAQLVAVCIVGEDPEGFAHLQPLIPDPVTWDILAYNLACRAARAGDRAETLRFTRRALELGKSPDQFVDDSDFEDLVEDAEFVALLDAHR